MTAKLTFKISKAASVIHKLIESGFVGTAVDIAHKTGYGESLVREYMRWAIVQKEKTIRICGYVNKHHSWAAVYAEGSEPDEEMPRKKSITESVFECLEIKPATVEYLCEKLGLTQAQVSSSISRMRDKIYIHAWSNHERTEWPRAVWAVGVAEDAPRPDLSEKYSKYKSSGLEKKSSATSLSGQLQLLAAAVKESNASRATA